MPWTTHLLVVASRTAESSELISYLRERARTGPVHVTLVVPLEVGGRDAGRERLEGALARLHEIGIEAVGQVAGDGEPLHAVLEVYDPKRHDEIIVVTLPEHLSRWLRCDLPHRIAQVTGALVRHIEVSERRAAVRR
ncbi:hypothetical protein [Capillimicrobium parvum]|uniref:Universal stress protein n=1 Tax=Capillimicrobium parvum TaxID=2884022 RepID=A0A9E6XYE0_9ACTN|nr:hypothetical protein [Capillimicrobium parvum]UGS36725.1 hypothetical protein DSM104329_03134 [Capillimicrobium parvum]